MMGRREGKERTERESQAAAQRQSPLDTWRGWGSREGPGGEPGKGERGRETGAHSIGVGARTEKEQREKGPSAEMEGGAKIHR